MTRDGARDSRWYSAIAWTSAGFVTATAALCLMFGVMMIGLGATDYDRTEGVIGYILGGLAVVVWLVLVFVCGSMLAERLDRPRMAVLTEWSAWPGARWRSPRPSGAGSTGPRSSPSGRRASARCGALWGRCRRLAHVARHDPDRVRIAHRQRHPPSGAGNHVQAAGRIAGGRVAALYITVDQTMSVTQRPSLVSRQNTSPGNETPVTASRPMSSRLMCQDGSSAACSRK